MYKVMIMHRPTQSCPTLNETKCGNVNREMVTQRQVVTKPCISPSFCPSVKPIHHQITIQVSQLCEGDRVLNPI